MFSGLTCQLVRVVPGFQLGRYLRCELIELNYKLAHHLVALHLYLDLSLLPVLSHAPHVRLWIACAHQECLV